MLSVPRAEGDDDESAGSPDDGADAVTSGAADQPADEAAAPGPAEQPAAVTMPDAPAGAEAAEHDVPAVLPGSSEPAFEPADPTEGASSVPAPELPDTDQPPAPVVAATPDAACAAAVEVARAAALEVAADTGTDAVGDHLGVEAEPAREGELVVTHSFAATQPGYRGWRWAVTVVRVPDSDAVTVDEVVLLPGGEALLAPAWVPWSDRVRPDDLGPGDVLPPAEDDPRLVPSYEDVDADQLPFDLHRDLGLGRRRVLSTEGVELAAERWFEGEQGPFVPRAKQAPGRCGECGFLAPMGGRLGRLFGVCANALAPDDGRVVALLHGCGAHSETVTTSPHASTTELVVEHEELELVALDVEPAEG